MARGRPKGSKDSKPRAMTHKPWESSPVIKNAADDMPDEYNSKMVQFTMEIMPAEPLDIQDVDEMERRFVRYVETCNRYGMKVGNLAAYMAIGISKEQAWEWENVTKGMPRRTAFIKKVRQFCAVCRENLMADGKVNVVTGLFWQKNYDGLKDQQEVVLTPNNPMGDQVDAESLRNKYLASTYDAEALPQAEGPEVVVDLQKAAEGV